VSEKAYRQRLEADLAQWQADGVITPAARDAIRATFRPLPAGIDVPTVIAILGGLLIAAAFLAFVAANWTEIARPLRFLMLLAGIAGAYGAGAVFAHKGRTYLSDISATVGSIIFGAAIALVGQMYHLGDDFAGGMALLACGALVAAVLTGSHGALAVALLTGGIWHGWRSVELADIQLPFLVYCFVGGVLAVVWNSPVARHLVGLALLGWWFGLGLGLEQSGFLNYLVFTFASGAALVFGGGLALASRGPEPVTSLGATISIYGALAFAIALAWIIAAFFDGAIPKLPPGIHMCAGLGVILALIAAGIRRTLGSALAGAALALGLIAIFTFHRPVVGNEPWLSYALALAAMLCLVLSGILDGVRTRFVAGWIGLGCVIAAITWSLTGSLLQRAVFLSIAGGIAIAFAFLLARLRPEKSA
jgi:uncharacterized membrane protein